MEGGGDAVEGGLGIGYDWGHGWGWGECGGVGGFAPCVRHPRPRSCRRLCPRLCRGLTLVCVLVSGFVHAVAPSFVPSYGLCGVGAVGLEPVTMVDERRVMRRRRHRGSRIRLPGGFSGTCGHRGWCNSDGVGGAYLGFPSLLPVCSPPSSSPSYLLPSP